MNLLFVGPIWEGSTALHRLEGFRSIPGVEVRAVDSMERVGRASLLDRLWHRLRLPRDRGDVNHRLLEAVAAAPAPVLFVDSCRILTRTTVRRIRSLGVEQIAFYSPDDMSARHNSSRQVESCEREWDVYFTTKSFNVPELLARGARRPVLIGNSYHPPVHHPMSQQDVGADFERFDVVFVGTWEADRMRSLNALAEVGHSVVVYGNGWNNQALNPRMEVRTAVYEAEYTRALHVGRVAVCFLRKLNRDLVTTRSVEIPAAQRPMVAEKTVEHDALFVDGTEYLGFQTDAELVERVTYLLQNEDCRLALARAGRERCLTAGYSTEDRAREMLSHIRLAEPAASR